MSKINKNSFIAEMIKGYKEDRASALSSITEPQVETADKTADSIEEQLTATTDTETISTDSTEEGKEE